MCRVLENGEIKQNKRDGNPANPKQTTRGSNQEGIIKKALLLWLKKQVFNRAFIKTPVKYQQPIGGSHLTYCTFVIFDIFLFLSLCLL